MRKKTTYSFFYYWSPVLLYCLIIFFQSSFPTITELPEIPYSDKIIHFFGYAFLGLLLLRGFTHSRFSTYYKSIIIGSILLTGLYGASDELHQHYIPYRSSDFWDILFDLLGGVFGVLLYGIIFKMYPKIRRV